MKHKRSLILVKLLLTILSMMLIIVDVGAWFDDSQHKTNRFQTKSDFSQVVLEKRAKDNEGNILVDRLLEGAVFELYMDPSNTRINGEFTTDEYGEIQINDLPLGHYYFLEVRPPSGFDFDVDELGALIKKYPFEIVDKQADYTIVKAYNRIKDTSLSLTKTVINRDGSAVTQSQLTTLFTFSVSFGDGGSYNYRIDGGQSVGLASGDSLQLKHGQTAVFDDLPYGLQYSIEEVIDHDYIVVSRNNSGSVIGNQKAEFDNIYCGIEKGTVALRKDLVNKDGSELTSEQLLKEFEFTISFSDGGSYPLKKAGKEAVNVTSGDTVTLKHNEYFYILEIPTDVTYTFTESDYSSDGYTTQNQVVSGNVNSGSLVSHVVTNLYQSPCPPEGFGSLTLHKMVLETTNQDFFEFTFEFSPKGDYEYRISGGEELTYKEGDSISISPLQTIKFNKLPTGTKYIVKENKHPNYVSVIESTQGAIGKDWESIANFVNVYKEEKTTGMLKISKTVVGIETDKSFEFTLQYEENVETFILKHGESKSFDLPIGTHYSVSEKDYSSEGYVLSLDGGQGTIVEKEASEVQAVNTYFKENIRTLISGEKTWVVDSDHQEAIPSTIIVHAMRDGGVIVDSTEVKPDESGQWNYEFDLPKYDVEGNEIQYYVEEEPIAFFSPKYSGYDIENTYQYPVSITPTVKKEIVGNPVVDSVFTFNITPIDDAPIVSRSSIQIVGENTNAFKDIVFTEPGTYQYRIWEKDTRNPEYVYDVNEVILTVNIDSVDGITVLESLTYIKSMTDTEDTVARFINQYIEEKPTNPNEPEKPEPPTAPEVPEQPDKPGEPADPGEDEASGNSENTQLPSTGVSPSTLNLKGSILILLGLNLILRKRLDEDKKREVV